MAKAYNFRQARSVEPKYRSGYVTTLFEDGAESYHGCATHHDVNCLCDVVVKEPTPCVAVPDFLLDVEDVYDLYEAVASLWMKLDVEEAIPEQDNNGFDRNDGRFGALNDALGHYGVTVMRGIFDRVQNGEASDTIKADWPLVTERELRLMRRACDRTARKRPRLPIERVKELVDQGLTMREVERHLEAEMGEWWDQSKLTRAFKEAYGMNVSTYQQGGKTNNEIVFPVLDEHGDILTVPDLMEMTGLSRDKCTRSRQQWRDQQE